MYEDKSAITWVVGALPPPLTGKIAVTAAVVKSIRDSGAMLETVDISAATLSRSIMTRLGRLPAVLQGIGRIAKANSCEGGNLYISISGGAGQVYELLFVLLARAKRMHIFLHHHSFAYLDRWKLLAKALVAVSGPNAIHIALSPGMANRLRDQYKAHEVKSISNSVFLLSDSVISSPRESLKKIGFLGNITAEKGIYEFLDVCRLLEDRGLSVSAMLAGPFQDRETENNVRRLMGSLNNVTYMGPQYGEDKESFFASIDVLIFPSQYINEAEPLTIHEAMSRCLPVVAYDRGAISEIVDDDSGYVIGRSVAFAPEAAKKIEYWCRSEGQFRNASVAARRRFALTYERNQRHWYDLMNKLTRKPESGCK